MQHLIHISEVSTVLLVYVLNNDLQRITLLLLMAILVGNRLDDFRGALLPNTVSNSLSRSPLDNMGIEKLDAHTELVSVLIK